MEAILEQTPKLWCVLWKRVKLHCKFSTQISHPPSFGMLLMPIKMMSMVQSVDGFRLDLNMGISQAF